MKAVIVPADVLQQLRRICQLPDADEIVIERRGDRAMAVLPGGRIAWFGMTLVATEQLRAEDRVLGLVSSRCGFPVPLVLAGFGGDWTLRSMIPGRVDPDDLASRLKSKPTLIPKVGTTLASMLAEQHTRIVEGDVAGWLATAPGWPMPRKTISDRLPSVIDDADLRKRIERLLDAYDAIGTRESDRALIHGDFGLHNLAFDPGTGAINGVFDYGSAAWADRHLDFRYLVFGAVQDALLDETIAAYHQATGFTIDRRRVLLCNAAAAISHLADRIGHGPDEIVAGRGLAGDLRWTGWALARAGF